MEKEKQIKVSVRNLVEFIMRSGSIDTSQSGISDPSLMAQGTKIHKKIQNSMGINYSSEVTLCHTSTIEYEGEEFEICVDGRADGIIKPDESVSASKSYLKDEDGEFEDRSLYIIDEIKGVVREVDTINKPVREHIGQAKCYAYFYAVDNNLEDIKIRITYCNLENELKRYFTYKYNMDELKEWYKKLLWEYAKWAKMQLDWRRKRDESITKLEFPFEYRQGQRDLVASVYTSIVREKKIYIEAPTGIGKTISTVFPSVKAMGGGLISKIFYLTAKTITRTAAQNTFSILERNGLLIKTVIITAKEKICFLDDKPECNLVACDFADGHFDRINDAVYDMIIHENNITRDVICEYAKKHKVCPYEMSLDASLWTDAIICDYNYAFDPDVCLKRYFVNDKKNDYVFLIDEAHNLVERARSMYSASIVKEDFLKIKGYVKNISEHVTKELAACNKILLTYKRNCKDCEVISMGETGSLYMALLRLVAQLDKLMSYRVNYEGSDEVLDFYFKIRKFLNTYMYIDENYIIYEDYDENDNFNITIQCMNPSVRLKEYLEKGKCAVFFSATLLPVNFYKEQLSAKEDDYAVYVPSPFDKKNRLIMIGRDVSTKYSRRSDREYEKISDYIMEFSTAKMGNYLVFFPSYKMMEDIYNKITFRYPFLIHEIVMQTSDMCEEQREEFLDNFKENPDKTHIGFCVMGGIYSEGIDLTGNRLIGTVIVGTGLPMVCNERELFREYYDDINGKGFDYAYLFGGMNKVMQSAGRVIRTKDDTGCILLLDERFLTNSYTSLFPREWWPYSAVNVGQMKKMMEKFWNENTGD